MRQVFLTRKETSDEGTFSDVLLTPLPILKGGELPYRDVDGDGKSDSNYSCINPGTYLFKKERSEKRSKKEGKDVFVYRMQNSGNRIAIDIHSGNFCGDIKKGFLSHIEGCILLGKSIGRLKRKENDQTQKAILESKAAMEMFEQALNGEPFELVITEDFKS